MSRQRIFVRLKDKTGRFFDSKTKFRVKLDEVKELVYPLGDATRECLNAGGLVITPETPTLPPPESTGIISTDIQPGLLSTAEIDEVERAIKPPTKDQYDYMGIQDLRQRAKNRGIKLSRTDSAAAIRYKLRTA